MLNKVIASPLALKAFRSGEKLFNAIEYTDEFEVQFENAMKNALNQLERADSLTVKIKRIYSNLFEDLKNINRILRKIRTVGDEIEGGRFDEEF